MITTDALIREVRATRDQHAARFGYDLKRIFADIKARQEVTGRTYITYPPRRIEAIAKA